MENFIFCAVLHETCLYDKLKVELSWIDDKIQSLLDVTLKLKVAGHEGVNCESKTNNDERIMEIVSKQYSRYGGEKKFLVAKMLMKL